MMEIFGSKGSQGVECRILRGSSPRDVVPALEEYPEVFLVYDAKIEALAREISSVSRADGTPLVKSSIPLAASEEGKDMSTVLVLEQWLLEAGADRDALLLAVGGGITTDVAGFAASIYKRGIRFAFIPTTLLAMVDAATGGKTGVNFLSYKNMLGVIRQSEFTFICPSVLGTLPYREFAGGSAEMLKSFIIDDSSRSYRKAVSVLSGIYGSVDHPAAIAASSAELGDLIFDAVSVKAGIVARDPYENGERRKLNLGHTFAHAIETLSRRRGGDISHGEAVSMGIALAARLSLNLAGSRPGSFSVRRDEVASLEGDLALCGLPVECPYPLEDMAEAMSKDKKAVGDGVRFVLVRGIGDVCTEYLTVAEAIDLLKVENNLRK